ncbi:hypothetical protein DPMN_088566 [Dreissena polymorpha]|uniref:Uncharacterized protein n=1 Tax=Dreissena polymorpha TaxID=45954 RepID=A0A9D4KW33_DREPO|nr:hypothetical protein DPMN_088566 [Dreissena polymorpha]
MSQSTVTVAGTLGLTALVIDVKVVIELDITDCVSSTASGTDASVRELDNIASAIAAGGRELNAHMTRGRQIIQSDIEAGTKELEDFKSKKHDENYNAQCKCKNVYI